MFDELYEEQVPMGVFVVALTMLVHVAMTYSNQEVPISKESTADDLIGGSNDWNYKPKILQYPTNQNQSSGGQASFYCEAYYGYPSYGLLLKDISWYKRIKDSYISVRNMPHCLVYQVEKEASAVLGSRLTIQDIDDSDYGTYVCMMANGVGTSKVIVELGPASEYNNDFTVMTKKTFTCDYDGVIIHKSQC